MAAPATVTLDDVLDAAREIVARGRVVNGGSLRQQIGRGDPRRLFALWEQSKADAPPETTDRAVAPAVTLPPLVSLTEPVEAAVSVATVRNHTEPSSDEKPTLGYVWSAPKPKPVNVSTAVCQWPSDIPGTRRFTLCGCPVERHGRPYCGAHADKAYIRRKVVYAD